MFTWWEIIALIFISFWGGFIVAAIVNKWSKHLLKHQTPLLIGSLALGLLCFKWFNVHAFYKLFSAGFIVFSAVLLENYLDKNNKIVSGLAKLGDYSYSTYLLHVFVLSIGLHYFGNKLGYFREATFLVGISTTLYILSRYSYLFLEQNKYTLSLKRYLLTSVNN